MSLHICQTCEHKEQTHCYGGCRCMVDQQPLLDHVMNQSCPAGKFGRVSSRLGFSSSSFTEPPIPSTPAPVPTMAAPETSDPSFFSRLGHGAAGLAKAALGIDRAEDFRVEYRRQTCEACPYALHRLGVVDTCSLCKCVIRAKTAIASEHCPVGKW